MKHPFLKPALLLAALGASTMALADYEVEMHLIDADGVGKSIGEITISESEYGTVFSPSLKELPPGSALGFHVHQKSSCEPARKDEARKEPGQAAGEHYDPDKSEKHSGPFGAGHRGDLPTLNVTDEGKATQPVVAPRLKIDELKDKSLVIHLRGDNYSDKPEAAGGSGKRIACGVVKAEA